MKRKSIGLVLGGGGGRCFAHLGVYDVLLENNVKINYIASSSMGSLMGVFIANRIPTNKIKIQFYKFVTRLSWFKPTLSRNGFFSQSNIGKLLKSLIPQTTLEELKIPITIVATDLTKGEPVLLEKGNIVKAVCASAAFPGIYKPVMWHNKLLADGGIVNNIPADICREKLGMDGLVISSVLDSKFDTSLKSLNNSFQIVWRSIYIPLIKSREKIVKENSDIVLKPLKDSLLNFHNWRDILKFYNPKMMESFYQKGRQEAKREMPAIKRLIRGDNR